MENIPSLGPYVCKAIVEDSRILDKGLHDQWEYLIYRPLQKLPTSSQDTRIVLVIDALNECEDDRDASLVMGVLVMAVGIKNNSTLEE